MLRFEKRDRQLFDEELAYLDRQDDNHPGKLRKIVALFRARARLSERKAAKNYRLICTLLGVGIALIVGMAIFEIYETNQKNVALEEAIVFRKTANQTKKKKTIVEKEKVLRDIEASLAEDTSHDRSRKAYDNFFAVFKEEGQADVLGPKAKIAYEAFLETLTNGTEPTRVAIAQEKTNRASAELEAAIRKAEAEAFKAALDAKEESSRGLMYNWALVFGRIVAVALLLFLVQIVNGIYRYNKKMAGFYSGRADALELFALNEENDISKLASILSPDNIDFGKQPKSPINTTLEFLQTTKGK